MSWQLGRHLIKAGAEFMFLEYVPISYPNTYGTYQFSSGQAALASATDGTGSALASFLLIFFDCQPIAWRRTNGRTPADLLDLCAGPHQGPADT